MRRMRFAILKVVPLWSPINYQYVKTIFVAST
jgi:hypothetical protein